PDGAPVQHAERLVEAVGRLPRAADRAELEQLLGMLESRAVNFALAGIPRRFTAMSPPQRERYLAGWATSRLGLRRRAFQALKRLATVLYYTATDPAGQSPVWADLKYPGPLGPPPPMPKRIQPLAVTGDTKLDCDVVVIGSGAGGGAVVNYTTGFRTPDGVREQWADEHNLPHFLGPEFSASLDAVARRVNVNTDECRPSGRDEVLIRGLDRLEWDHGFLPRDTRGCPQDDECGYCGFGCRRGAKQSTLVTYLQDAADCGARIVVDCEVRG